MAQTAKVKLIPSPYPVVREYEEKFVKDGIDFIAGAVDQALQIIKKQYENGATGKSAKPA